MKTGTMARVPTHVASPPAVEWSTTFSNAAKGSSVCLCADGGYVVAGITSIGDTVNGNVYLAKVDAHGALLWELGYGGPGQDEGLHVEPTSDGGYIVSGWTSRPGVALLLKTDSSGKLLWQRTYDGPEPVDGNCVVATPSGGYFIICDAEDDYAALVIRTNPSGVETRRATMVNRLSNRTARDGVLCSDGGCLIAGWTDSCSNTAQGYSNSVYYAKINEDGTLAWQKVHVAPRDNMAYGVTRAADGGFALAGAMNSQADRLSHFYLLRINAQGNFQWDSTYAGTDDAIAYSICGTFDGGYALAGVKGNRPHVVRTDTSGHMLWEKTLEVGGGCSWASAIRRTPDGGYIITGSHQGSAAELFLTKLAPDRMR